MLLVSHPHQSEREKQKRNVSFLSCLYEITPHGTNGRCEKKNTATTTAQFLKNAKKRLVGQAEKGRKYSQQYLDITEFRNEETKKLRVIKFIHLYPFY